MYFASDNSSGVCPEIMEALQRAAGGYATAYGEDGETGGLQERFGALFGREVRIFPVITGTAANSLALSALTEPWGQILCHQGSHVYNDECGAPEFFSGGARVVPLPGAGGKIDPEALRRAAAHTGHGVHTSPARAMTITQATESGTVYTADEIARLTAIAHDHSLGTHLDGARFANAVASLGCAPAEITWKAGIDVMSFGATKNGALGAEAVVFFDPERAADFERRRMRGGHLVSKMRYLSVQLHAYLDDDLWLRNARNANRMAARLHQGLTGIDGVTLLGPAEANEVFAVLPVRMADRLREAGAQFYGDPFDDPAAAEPLEAIRLVASFCTTADDVDRFVEAGVAAAG
jgi:threonine aldolase